MTDETQFSGSSVMLKYAEKREELSLKKCMRKCFRYAGCVAFNFYEYEEYDVCELHSKMSEPVQNKETNVKVWVFKFCFTSLFLNVNFEVKTSKNFNSYLTLRRPLRKKLRMRWFFDVSRVKETRLFKSDITNPPQNFIAHLLENTELSPSRFHFSVGFISRSCFSQMVL